VKALPASPAPPTKPATPAVLDKALAAHYRDFPPPSPSLTWSWTGLYIGVNAGWIDSSELGRSITNTGRDTGKGGLGSALAAGKIPGSVGLGRGGIVGGVTIKYDFQIGLDDPSWVLGMAADMDGEGGGSSSTTVVFPGHPTPLSTSYNRELNTLGTIRGRFGYVPVPDQLWYVTGGLAFGQTKIGSAFTCVTCIPPSRIESSTVNQTSNTSAGWAAGAGIEWKFDPRWSANAEYLYIDLGAQSNTITYRYGGNTSSLTSTVHEGDSVVRLGISYKLF
jgi:outer membrane immunogenic protein